MAKQKSEDTWRRADEEVVGSASLHPPYDDWRTVGREMRVDISRIALYSIRR